MSTTTTTTTATATTTNGTTPLSTTKIPSPAKLAHVVLRTNNFAAQLAFYTTFLNARIMHQNPQIAFLSYDDEHHRIALVNMPHIADKVRESCGIEHVAFTYGSLGDLLGAWRGRAEEGLRPVWCVNHRVTTSLYYKDCDGNLIETQVDNFGDDVEVANRIMGDGAFATNPLGHDFDPEELWKQYQEEGEEAVMDRLRHPTETGEARGLETIPKSYME